MTKLRRKLQQLAKKRAHRKVVQKRKFERATKELEAKRAEKEAALEEMVDADMVRLSEPEKAAGSSGDVTAEYTSAEKKIIAGLVVTCGPAIKKSAKKQMTRKQLKRKEKIKEKGTAVAAQIDKKWNIKKMRVKQRAQVRNENLHN